MYCVFVAKKRCQIGKPHSLTTEQSGSLEKILVKLCMRPNHRVLPMFIVRSPRTFRKHPTLLTFHKLVKSAHWHCKRKSHLRISWHLFVLPFLDFALLTTRAYWRTAMPCFTRCLQFRKVQFTGCTQHDFRIKIDTRFRNQTF